MRKIITVLFLFGLYSGVFAQAAFTYEPSIEFRQTVALDFGSGTVWEDVFLKSNTGWNYGFQSETSNMNLKGGAAYIKYENGATIDLNSVKLYYRVYRSDEPAPNYNSITLLLSPGGEPRVGTKNYINEFQSINLLEHSIVDAAGTYYIDFYYEAETSNPGTINFYIASTPARATFETTSALPVELTTFTAFAEENKVALAWETATEVNNYGFEIERQKTSESQLNLSNWEKIGFVEGHGNSNSPKSYSYSDNTVTSGDYYYRLRQVDIDGQFEYSDVLEVKINAPNEFELSQNYPNPFNPKTSIQFSLTDAANVSLLVYNTIGQQVAELINQRLEAGIYNEEFDATNFNSGIYIYVLKTEKATITRKMILMK